MKHIVLFSGGAASSVAASLVVEKYGREDTILLHTPTYAEHPDADRFRASVAKHLGMEITVAQDGRSLWQVIEDEMYIPLNFVGFCTGILKRIPGEKFVKEIKSSGEDVVIYMGFGREEYRRVQRNAARQEQNGVAVAFPLYEAGITSEEAKKIVLDDWKICLPEPYKWLKHNNCIPCFKGSKRHFYAAWKHYPVYFQKAIDAEKMTGYTVFQNESLSDLAAYWAAQATFDFGDEEDFLPCMCAV